jgi:GAF domain-containing protein
MIERERWLARTLVAMADTAMHDFDLDRFLAGVVNRYPELLEGTEAGIILTGADGTEETLASTSERIQAVQQFEAAKGEGAGIEACRFGQQVVNLGLEERERRWPHLAPLARAVGIRAIHALPLRHRGEGIGAVTVYSPDDRQLTSEELDIAQAIADAASIGIMQVRALGQCRELADQLQGALDSRVAIEQAKGVLAERLAMPLDDAFTLMRRHARSHQRRLESVAQAVVRGTMSATELRVAS